MRVTIRQGASGRWRWLAYKGRKFKGQGHPYGHSSEPRAARAAREFFGSEVTIETADGEHFAGERDVEEN